MAAYDTAASVRSRQIAGEEQVGTGGDFQWSIQFGQSRIMVEEISSVTVPYPQNVCDIDPTANAW